MYFADLNLISASMNFDIYKKRAGFIYMSLIFELKLGDMNAY